MENSFLTKLEGENKPTSITTKVDQVLFALAQEVRGIAGSVMAGSVTNQELADKIPELLTKLNNWKDSITKFSDVVKDKTLELVKNAGQKVTDKGSLSMDLGGWQISARPTRTGVDPKKLEQLLRNKKIDTGIAMDMEIKLIINNDKIAYCLAEGIFTQEELDSCKYEINYSVMPPKRI